MKLLLFILFFSLKSFSQDLIYSKQIIEQDSVLVKILKVKGNSVWMKTIERPRIKLFTFCKCPYKRGEIVWIKKP